MSNCNACKKPLKASEKATCARTACARQYHFACVNLSTDAYKKIQAWACPLCTSKQPRSGDNTDTPVKMSLTVPVDETSRANVTIRRGTPTPSPTSPLDDVVYPVASRQDTTTSSDVSKTITDAMSVQFQALGERMSSLETSVKYLSGQCDDMFRFYSETKASIAALCDENKQLHEELYTMKKRTKALEDAQARQEQWSRAQNIEVVGVPESKDESPVDVIIKVAAQAGVSLQNGDIEYAHRVQSRRPSGAGVSGAGVSGTMAAGTSRVIIARFKNRAAKDSVVAAARKNRHITSKDIGFGGEVRKIFVNEHLTKENKQLLKSCKIKAAESNYKHVWTKNCRIYMRKSDTSRPIPIISSSDLAQIN